MMAPHDHTWPTNADFPDLTDVTVIARGAHATVYRAHQVSARRDVALKVDNRAVSSPAERDRFAQETEAVRRLGEHPGIIDVYDADVTPAGLPYTVTQLCRGSYADHLARHGALPPDDVQRIGIRIADALALAHEHRVLHRDIKPANLLIDQDGEPVLADFGVATLMEPRPGEQVSRAAMTPAYAPLETFHLRPSGEAGDVYSLAATLYALLSGHPPRFPADDREFGLDDVMALFGEPIADIPGVSQVMLGMLRAAMTNNPAGRPSAMQFRDMLDSVPMAAATTTIPAVRPPADLEPVARPPAEAAPPVRPPAEREPAAVTASAPAQTEWAQEVKPPSPSPRRPQPTPHQAWGRPATAPMPPAPRTPHDEPASGEAPWRDPADDARLPVPMPSRELLTRRERRIAERGGKESGGLGQLLLVGGIAIAIIVAALAGGLWLINSDDDPTLPEETRADTETGCVVEEFGVACLSEPLCFTGVLVDGDDMAAAEAVSCEEAHDWEAYAKGELPEDISGATYGDVIRVDAVKQSCLAPVSESPLMALLGNSAADWQSDVLPPTAAQFEEGNREFLCVAGPRNGEPTSGSLFATG
ncbi:serine/threonine-protein kinase [Stackebrandtia albiflava]|nr:serine/threonine-protein kinase [Stackebrandtia albiflava]